MAIPKDRPPPEIAALQSLFYQPVVQKAVSEIEAVAGYRLNNQLRAPFLHFHAFITMDPPPRYITNWRSDPARNRWYHCHVNGVLGHVQNALACVFYHRDNLCAIEDSVRQIFLQSGAQAVLGNSTIGLGNTIRWDAEYQAFVLAVRRCLDYLARAMATYFQNDHHSFRRLPGFLRNVKPAPVSLALADACKRHEANFAYVLSDGKRKSIRDLLSHYEYISAGSLNIGRTGFLVAGGGENLKPVSGVWDGGLSAIIRKRADELHACIGDVLATFVAAAREQDERPDA